MTESDQDKIDMVYKYLSGEFPESTRSIHYKYDTDSMGFNFTIGRVDTVFIVKITKKCWDDYDANSLFEHLKKLDVANELRKNPDKNVIVNNGFDLDFEPK